MILRPATLDDARLLLDWRNDPTTRRFSRHKDEIAWPEHLAWLVGRLQSAECRIWIGMVDGVPVGQIRYEREEGPRGKVAEISYSIAREQRGKGYGTTILRASRDLAWEELELSAIVGEVEQDNIPSRRAFERCGFAWTEPEGDADYLYRWPL